MGSAHVETESTDDLTEESSPYLSPEQTRIFDFLLGHSWRSAMSEFGIRSVSSLETIVMRTALGCMWIPGHHGGPRPYLNKISEERLAHLLDEMDKENDCVRKCDALVMACKMRQEMLMHAREIIARTTVSCSNGKDSS